MTGPGHDLPEAPAQGWPAPLAVLAVVAMLAAAALAASLAAELVAGPQARDVHGLPEAGPAGVWRSLVWLIAFQAALVAQTLAAAGFFGGSPRRVLALDPPRGGAAALGRAVALLVAFSVAYAAAVLLLDRAALLRDVSVAMALARSDAWLLALAAIGLGAPLSEELVFRGFLFQALARSRLGLAGAAVVATLGWTALHAGYSVYGLGEVFLIGLYFSWLLVRSGSLWVPILCHALYNTVVFLGLRWLPIPL